MEKVAFIIRRLFKQLDESQTVARLSINYAYKLSNSFFMDIYSVSKKEVGERRNNIDLPKTKKDKNFQISLLRVICDHIAGMTDHYALQEYQKLYGS